MYKVLGSSLSFSKTQEKKRKKERGEEREKENRKEPLQGGSYFFFLLPDFTLVFKAGFFTIELLF